MSGGLAIETGHYCPVAIIVNSQQWTAEQLRSQNMSTPLTYVCNFFLSDINDY